MNGFDPQNVNCPNCKKTRLRPINDSGQIIAYNCPECKSLFDVNHYTDLERGMVNYIARRRNPEVLAQLDSEDWFENLKKADEMDRKGTPFYLGIFNIGSKKIEG